ncbi:MAG TPA: bifunctional adenosylcobinamide kinase/adenosylcobinamide-phosphate guanylyltransferase [Ilumatobacteraceae bacterium]|nr:bifunctional adenosylcobinamide kinase/adenosylcobinamide-phosphate guanylyltransferase [Ilumatobacteraceae bacterium]
MGEITFLIGGARSGKSTLAVRLGHEHAQRERGRVTVIATAVAFDEDLRARIQRHRDERPAWPTVEEPIDLAGAISSAPDDDLLIIDCLTVWVATMMHHDRMIDATAVADALSRRAGPAVVISNEVGLGIVPDNELSRVYRDELGRVNQLIARTAQRTMLMLAGMALPLQSIDDVLATTAHDQEEA